MSKKKIMITVDGPVASGKGTVCSILCSKLNYKMLSTGTIYRAIAYSLDKQGITPETFKVDDLSKIKKIEFDSSDRLILGGVDVEDQIRTPGIGKITAPFSSIYEIRMYSNQIQRDIASEGGFVLDGRDSGTVVLPHAELKVFLDAPVEIRAKRRFEDFKRKGIDISLEEVKKQTEERDYIDRNKGEFSLRIAEGALYIDNSEISAEEQVEMILERYNEIVNKT